MNANTDADRRLADRDAIQDAIYRWCRAVDRRDWESIRSVFHPDGNDNHGLYNGDVGGLIAWLTERHKTITCSLHTATNILIEFYGPNEALVETYVTACQRYAPEGAATLAAISGRAAPTGNPVDMLLFGRYVDRFECRNGQWKILQRVTVFDNTMMFDVPSGGAKLGAGWTVGQRNQDDPIFKIRREVGLAL